MYMSKDTKYRKKERNRGSITLIKILSRTARAKDRLTATGYKKQQRKRRKTI